MATKQIDEYYESLAYWKQQALDHEQELRDIKCNTIMNMAAEIEQLKAENLLLSDDRELYMRHRDILIDALRVVESHNGINTHYPIVYATTKQALRDVGEI